MTLLRRIGVGDDAKTIRARIPQDLAEDLDAFDRDARRQGFEFPRDDIVVDALRKALAKARAELDRLTTDEAAERSSEPAPSKPARVAPTPQATTAEASAEGQG